MWDLARKKRLWRKKDGERYHTSLSFSPDGETLATITFLSNDLHFWRRKDGAAEMTVSRRCRFFAQYRPDGTMILDAVNGTGFKCWEPLNNRVYGPDDKKAVPLFRQHDESRLVLSGNGETVAFIDRTNTGLFVFNLWPVTLP